MSESKYYDKIIDITKDYLGPAADRFVDRQIKLHFKKPPSEIAKNDIPMLAVRIRSGLVVLTRNKKLVHEAFQRISAMAD